MRLNSLLWKILKDLYETNLNMKKDNIGEYQDQETGKVYRVNRLIQETVHRPLYGKAIVQPVSYSYIASCGIDLNPMDKIEFSFEMIQIDGIISKVDS